MAYREKLEHTVLGIEFTSNRVGRKEQINKNKPHFSAGFVFSGELNYSELIM